MSDDICSRCNGSGQGQHEGLHCDSCNGSGTELLESEKEQQEMMVAMQDDFNEIFGAVG